MTRCSPWQALPLSRIDHHSRTLPPAGGCASGGPLGRLDQDQEDAALLLRPDVGNVPTLHLPRHQLDLLTPELVKPLHTIAVLQRLDTLDDGF